MPHRLPTLLIIGAQKSGTTSLYMDLADNAGVYLAENKEPHSLCHDRVLTDEGLQAYAAHYTPARPDQLLCDASTGYTKMPEHTGVVERACQVLPEGFRAIYIVRHPVERALSHYRHDFANGHAGPEANRVLREESTYVDNSRYGFQLRPWLDRLGPDRLLVMTLEDYSKQRSEKLTEICDFLSTSLVNKAPGKAKTYNKTDGKPLPVGVWAKIRYSTPYQRFIKPLIPLKARLALYKVLLPRHTAEHEPITEETRRWLESQLAEDTAEFARMLGKDDLWPTEQTVGAEAV